ncbi:MAG: prepilin-type N-terminal cleavage/methylation domain-containing protein, partial [Acidobacteriota bacterium]
MSQSCFDPPRAGSGTHGNRSDSAAFRSPRVKKNYGQRGFTLLELIVAFTILALLAGMVFSSLRLSLSSYEKSQERLEEEARRRVLF